MKFNMRHFLPEKEQSCDSVGKVDDNQIKAVISAHTKEVIIQKLYIEHKCIEKCSK